MAIFESVVPIETKARVTLLNITQELAVVVGQGNVSSGVATFFIPHTTAALLINEYEPRLVSDLEGTIRSLIPWDKHYEHNAIDHNAAAHIVGALIGPSVTVPVSQGEIDLGTWQSIFFIEMDGPRSRRVKITVVGE